MSKALDRQGLSWADEFMHRWYQPLMLGLSLLVLSWGAVFAYTAATGLFGHFWGVDIVHYLDGTRRWLATGSPYLPSEVASHFSYEPETFLHPPIALWLFLPFLVLPLPLWWGIPLTVTVWCIWSFRPAPWTWPVLAFALSSPRFHGAFITGNTDIWVLASVTAGLRYGWPALLIAAKPTLPFLALVGARDRSWWIGLFVVVLMGLPFGALWLDWIQVMRNSPGSLNYSVESLFFLLPPIVAWIGRSPKGFPIRKDDSL